MTETYETTATDEHIVVLRDSILALAKEAKQVLAEDVPQFYVREARRRFLAAPDFARALSDDDLHALKADLAAAAARAADQTLAALEDETPWLAGTAVDDPSGKHFQENPTLWERIAALGSGLAEVLQKHGFPEDEGGGHAVVYEEPKRFVSGHYMPSIAEKYWKRVAELKEAKTQRSAVAAERERQDLLARWDRF